MPKQHGLRCGHSCSAIKMQRTSDQPPLHAVCKFASLCCCPYDSQVIMQQRQARRLQALEAKCGAIEKNGGNAQDRACIGRQLTTTDSHSGSQRSQQDSTCQGTVSTDIVSGRTCIQDAKQDAVNACRPRCCCKLSAVWNDCEWDVEQIACTRWTACTDSIYYRQP